MIQQDTDIKRFLQVGHAEGISYLLLLGVAMPLKYFLGKPESVRILGMIHGVLFVGFIFMIAWLWQQKKMTFKAAVMAFVMSLIPFGTFFLNKLFPRGVQH